MSDRSPGSASRPVALGLVGCGRVAERLYAPAFREAAGVRLAALADSDRARRGLLAAAAGGVAAFASLEAMIGAERLDGVVIATPPSTHATLAEVALRAGLGVLVEKPLATRAEDGARIGSVAAEVERPVMVGFNRRHLAASGELRDLLAGRRPSRPVELRSRFAADPEVWDAVAEPGDLLDDLASHHLDLFRWLLAEEIEAVVARERGPRAVEIEAVTASGLRPTCLVSRGRESTEWVAVTLGGLRLRLRPASDRLRPAGGPARTLLDRMDVVRRRIGGRSSPMRRSFATQLERFGCCVRDAEPPRPGLEDGMAAMRAVRAVRASLAAGGRRVALSGELGR